MAPAITDVRAQLTFYGAYHNNTTNILIHVACVPWLLWSGQVLLSQLPTSSFLPHVHYVLNDYLVFDLNITALITAVYLSYYYILEPLAAFLYTPQLLLSLLTATAFSYRPASVKYAGYIQGAAWVAQFLGHGVAEKRAPALLDNLLGAVVLAPFFVHIETHFYFGYKPAMARQLKNDVGTEIARVKREERIKKEAKKI